MVLTEDGTLPTAGGVIFSVFGDNFGPKVIDCRYPEKNTIGAPCPSVWYTAEYTPPQYPSALRKDAKYDCKADRNFGISECATNIYTTEKRYDALDCKVFSHTEMQCQSAPASGFNLRWNLEIGEQEADRFIKDQSGNSVSHTIPKIVRVRYTKFVGFVS